MSQIIKQNGSGVLPPEVVEEIGVDFDSSGNPPGTVTPSNNKFYILGSTGIVTEAGTTDAANDTAYVLFANGAVQTTNNTPTTILTLSTDTNAGFTAQCLFTAYDAANGLVFGGRMTIIGKNVGGSASVISFLEKVKDGEGALSVADFSASGSGAFINISVTGVTGHTLEWTVITPGIVGGPIP